MLQLLIDTAINLYDNDAFRFGLWGFFDTLGIDSELIGFVRSLGYTIFEDYSITGGR